MLTTTLITPPVAEPVSLSQVKLALKVDFDDDDTYITALISAARELCESKTNRAFLSQTWMRSLDYFPLYGSYGDVRQPGESNSWPYGVWYWDKVSIELPHSPVQSVTSISYIGDDGTRVTLPDSSYNVDTFSKPCRISPAQGLFWPILNHYIPGNVQITYVAGSYGDGVLVNTTPNTVQIAIMLLVGHLYSNREASSVANLTTIPLGVDALLNSVKIQTAGYR
jgi:uncharacterized phiE125 gp8 family phage protein